MTPRPKNSHSLFAAGLLALLTVAPPLMAGEKAGSFVAATSQGIVNNIGLAIYVVDVSAMPPVVHGPFFEELQDGGFRLIMLRDAPLGVIEKGTALHLVDFSKPTAPAIVASAKLPFDPLGGVTRLSNSRDELLAMGPGGELVMIDPRTLGILASFTLPSPRIRARTSGDGRLLLTQEFVPPSSSIAFLASFDPVLGPAAEIPMRDDWPTYFEEAIFSADNRTAVLISTACFQMLLGPPFCESQLGVFDTSSPAKPVFREEINPHFDGVTSVVLDRAGGRLLFHRRGSEEWVTPHQVLPFTITGPGSLVAEPHVNLTARGDFEASGLVRTAGAKRLLVFTSETLSSIPTTTLARLHDLDPVTLGGSTFLLTRPLEPRGVFHIGADIFADGFESGTTGAWGPADLLIASGR